MNQGKSTASQYVSVDATHKIVSCDFKFSTFATMTLNQQIADIAYMVQTHEDADTYSYGLKMISQTLKKAFKFNWNPLVI